MSKPYLVIPQNFCLEIGNKDLASYGAGHPEKLTKQTKTVIIFSVKFCSFLDIIQFLKGDEPHRMLDPCFLCQDIYFGVQQDGVFDNFFYLSLTEFQSLKQVASQGF